MCISLNELPLNCQRKQTAMKTTGYEISIEGNDILLMSHDQDVTIFGGAKELREEGIKIFGVYAKSHSSDPSTDEMELDYDLGKVMDYVMERIVDYCEANFDKGVVMLND